MRKLLDWIATKLGYVRPGPRPFPRIDNGTDAIARGQRWEMFYAEKDGIADIILGLRQSYFEKVSALKPNDTSALMALGLADKVARDIDHAIRQIIETGKIARSNAEQAERLAATQR